MNKNYSISQEATFTCSATEGKPEAVISAHLGEGEELGDEDLELETDNEEAWETEQSATFKIIPAREDCGKFIRCSALQTGLQGEELFGGVKTISQKVKGNSQPCQSFTMHFRSTWCSHPWRVLTTLRQLLTRSQETLWSLR